MSVHVYDWVLWISWTNSLSLERTLFTYKIIFPKIFVVWVFIYIHNLMFCVYNTDIFILSQNTGEIQHIHHNVLLGEILLKNTWNCQSVKYVLHANIFEIPDTVYLHFTGCEVSSSSTTTTQVMKKGMLKFLLFFRHSLP